MGADKGKKQKLPEKSEDEINAIDGELVFSIEKLQEIQDELEKLFEEVSVLTNPVNIAPQTKPLIFDPAKINEEASEKVLEVEQKYNEVRKPIYDKRKAIVKSIPEFWITAFTSHPVLCELLSEEDHQIFKHLTSIEVVDSQDVKSGYSITFNFNPNPYFEDTKLTKTFAFHDEGTTKITGTTIRWKEGMGIPNGVAGVKTGDKRSRPEESFFSWFSEESDVDIEELHEEVADIIKDDLWPNPLTYFNAEADEVEFDEEGNDEGSDDDDEDEEDDDDENGED